MYRHFHFSLKIGYRAFANPRMENVMLRGFHHSDTFDAGVVVIAIDRTCWPTCIAPQPPAAGDLQESLSCGAKTFSEEHNFFGSQKTFPPQLAPTLALECLGGWRRRKERSSLQTSRTLSLSPWRRRRQARRRARWGWFIQALIVIGPSWLDY
jgi:hypothetical protein